MLMLGGGDRISIGPTGHQLTSTTTSLKQLISVSVLHQDAISQSKTFTYYASYNFMLAK